ncbi:MAG: selenocysteine-specific translation elongation factor [Anaerolineales bacterium]|nr:selenocysteine-specific translation elongation factor [Anaerolineales bacterium]
MRVIGTAGHVDHGKSTLVQALTGIHPDRLKEEREREMTIDLGFAWLTLPGGEEIGIVDVPGHRDFIENMLSGIGGIDAALFVIAADEGIMPQTREHLAILDLLQIKGGVIALTKVDLIDDPDWLDLVEEDVRQAMQNTVLGNAAIVRVSSRTRQGIPQLLQSLEGCLADQPHRPDLGRPRLPVDRVFTIAGFGTVVTGTLSDGQLKLGEEVIILPAGLRGRVRGLQTHKHKEERALPGSRTAVNITGIDVNQVQRGDVVTIPGAYHPTSLLDVQFRILPDAQQPLEHNTEVKFFIGAAEVLARTRLLGAETLPPGEHGWLQLQLNEPVVAMRGDRYIIRRPSPGETLGGGIIVDPQPRKRHKRFSADVIQRLETLSQGTPAEVLLQAMLALGVAPLQDVIKRSNLDTSTAQQAISELMQSGIILPLEGGQTPTLPSPQTLISSKGYWEELASRAVQEVQDYHKAHPLRQGMPREELKSRLRFTATPQGSRIFSLSLNRLVTEKALVDKGVILSHPDHSIRFNPQQQRIVDELLKRFAAAPYAPPPVKECLTALGDELYNALIEMGVLVPIPPDVVFRQQDYEHMLQEIRSLIQKYGSVTAAQVRDHFNTSRRYVLALLEHLDAQGITLREGDLRRLK